VMIISIEDQQSLSDRSSMTLLKVCKIKEAFQGSVTTTTRPDS
jgi:hypothetical protein